MPCMVRMALAAVLAGSLAGCGGVYVGGGGSVLGGFAGAPAPPSGQNSSYKARQYGLANDRLATAYQQLSAQKSPVQQQALAEEEAGWLRMRAENCTQDGALQYGCAARLTDKRIAALEARAGSPPPAAPAAPAATQTAQTFVVPVTAMPWLWRDGGMNAAYKFGYPNGTQPVTVDLDRLGAAAGSMVTVSYVSGRITLGAGGPQADASGFAGLDDHGEPGLMGALPSAYMQPYPINLGALVGAFTDHAGNIIGQPFAVGAGRMSRAVPPGASRLQLGINDDVFGGETAATRNTGSFTVAVSLGQGG